MSARRSLPAFAFALVAACHRDAPRPAPVRPAAPVAAPSGSIEGIVFLDAVPPALAPLEVPAAFANEAACRTAAVRYSRTVDTASTGPFEGALVAAEARDPSPIPPRRRSLLVRACDVVPRMVFATTADTIVVHDESGLNPIVHFQDGSTIDQVLIRGGRDIEKTFAHPGFYPMLVRTFPAFAGAGVYVLPNRFIDTSDAHGHFRIDHVPPGPVTVHAFYPNLTDVASTVTVRAGETVTAEFHLRPAPPRPTTLAPESPDAPTVDSGIVTPM